MAKEKKRGAPEQPCPKCGKPIHPRQKAHEECGWIRPPKDTEADKPATGIVSRRAKPGAAPSDGTAGDLIRNLEGLVSAHGADKIKQAVDFLEKFKGKE